MTPEAYQELIISILKIMMENGINATAMDKIASSLKISKRTLYEIFTSKEQLAGEVIKAYNQDLEKMHLEIARESENEIEAIFKIFLCSRDVMAKMNVEFYRDMDKFYAHAKQNSREEQFVYLHNMLTLIKEGIKKGLLRDDINYTLLFRMMVLQMESLKKMEETFPNDISLLDVYDTVCVSFLRGITSPSGMIIFDNLLSDHPEMIHRNPAL